MKIEIMNDNPSGDRGYKVFDLNKQKLIDNDNRNMFRHYWDDEDILNLLGDKKFEQFENGKFQFNVTMQDVYSASNNLSYYKPSQDPRRWR